MRQRICRAAFISSLPLNQAGSSGLSSTKEGIDLKAVILLINIYLQLRAIGVVMSRSFLNTMVRVSREIERANRARAREIERQQREARARVREAERQQLALEKNLRKRSKFEQELYVASREADVDAENTQRARRLEELLSLLGSRYGQDPSLDFKQLFKVADPKILDTVDGLKLPDKPAVEHFAPVRPSFFLRWISGVNSRHRNKEVLALQAFAAAASAYNSIVKKRDHYFRTMKSNIEQQNNSVIEFAKLYTNGDPAAVSTYFELILDGSQFPDAFPSERKIAFVEELKQLVIEFELPKLDDAVPAIDKFRYVKKNGRNYRCKEVRQSTALAIFKHNRAGRPSVLIRRLLW